MTSTTGTPFRLADNGKSLTSAGGKGYTSSDLVSLDVAGRKFTLASGQQVLTSDGFKAASDLRGGESRVALVRDSPLPFGDTHFPFTAFLLAVMSNTYDDKYRMISSDRFSEEDRAAILAAMPEAMKELNLEQKWPLYPNFVRVSTTDGVHQWVLTSPMFDHLTRESADRSFTVDASNTVIKGRGVTKQTALAWVRGFAVGGQADGYVRYPEALEMWNYFVQKMNLNETLVNTFHEQLNTLAQSSLPFHVNADEYHVLNEASRMESLIMTMFRFKLDYWIYPSYERPTSGGLVCKRGL